MKYMYYNLANYSCFREGLFIKPSGKEKAFELYGKNEKNGALIVKTKNN